MRVSLVAHEAPLLRLPYQATLGERPSEPHLKFLDATVEVHRGLGTADVKT